MGIDDTRNGLKKSKSTTTSKAPANKPGEEPWPGEIHVIHDRAVYTTEDVKRVLRLRSSTLRRELRLGRMRVSRRSGRHYYLGEWLLEWLRAGELPRRQPHTSTDEN